MIVRQIINWIVKNKEVYFANYRQISQKSNQIGDSLQKIIKELSKSIPCLLKQQKFVHINHFFTFFTKKNVKKQQIQPSYQLHSDLATIINCQVKPKAHKINNHQDIYKLVASALMMQRATVEILLNVFVKAIHDLIVNDNKICLNLQFCLIKLSKKQISCVFRKSFIKDLNEQQRQTGSTQILLHLCPTSKCKQKDKQNITKAYMNLYQQKQKQLEQGNIYKRASLREIKNLYDKGRNLQIKYKNLFQ